MDPNVLRDRTRLTRLLLLAQLRSGATLSAAAQRIGISVQAVSVHARALVAAGHATQQDGAYRATPAGLVELQDGLRGLRLALDEVAAPLADVALTSAVAATDVAVGKEVGLWMQDGDLHAAPGRASPSRGRARTAARTGEEVVVGELAGVVELTPGTVRVVAVPGPGEGGARGVDVRHLRHMVGAVDQVAAVGTGARLLAHAVHGRLDIRFAPARAAFHAAELGLDVVLYCVREELGEAVAALARANQRTLRAVPVEMVEAPRQR